MRQTPSPSPVVVSQGGGQATTITIPPRPLTQAEIAAVKDRRAELSNQLTSASGRRDEIAAQLERAAPAARAGLEERLAVLDKRIVQLETDMAETGRLLTSPAYTSTTAQQARSMGMTSGQTTALGIVMTLFVLAPLAISLARLIWRRGTGKVPAGFPDAAEAARRLAGLEQAVDAIAVEIERVSEGQRYVTKIFAESQGIAVPALGAGERPAEPIRVGQQDKAGISRDR
jgi:hypothetical protein